MTGPIRFTKTSYPSASAYHQLKPTNLKKWGYSEKEYFVAGKANIYAWGGDEKPVVQTPSQDYKTRMLVRAPNNPANWSGNVVVEIIHSSWNGSLTYQWMSSRRFLSNGDVWVGINTEGESQIGMKAFDSQRYGGLYYPSPIVANFPADQQSCAGGLKYDDGAAWDIMSQTGALLRSSAKRNPLHRLLNKSKKSEKLMMTGFSHSSFMTATYAHTFNDAARDAKGRRIWDGYFLSGSSQGLYKTKINACTTAIPIADPRNTAPIHAHVLVETEENTLFRNHQYILAWRTPDSDAPSHPYRAYEISGLAHDVIGEGDAMSGPDEQARMGLAPDTIAAVPKACLSQTGFPSRSVMNAYPLAALRMAMWRNLEDWIRKGIKPPPGRVIAGTVSGSPGAQTIAIDDDSNGNALGGIRLPWVRVPTATHQASYDSGMCPDFDGYIGIDHPFDQATLTSLYPTHTAYVNDMKRAVKQSIANRDLLPTDGNQMISAAQKSNVP